MFSIRQVEITSLAALLFLLNLGSKGDETQLSQLEMLQSKRDPYYGDAEN